MRIVLALGLAGLLAACAQPRELSVDGAWVRLGAVPGSPAAGYFVVHGGPAPATLISVTTDVAIKSEMHETMTAGGTKGSMSQMAPLQRVEIPANTDVAFKPGGRHVMLFNVNPGIKRGSPFTFTFAFSDGTRILQNANVIAAGDPGGK